MSLKWNICHLGVFPRSTCFSALMADHLSSCTDRLVTSECLNSERGGSNESSGESSRALGSTSLSTSKSVDPKTKDEEEESREQHDVDDEEEPLIQSLECRICQEEDSVKNLESPCSCSGSLKVNILE